jgi:hypothetical protein
MNKINHMDWAGSVLDVMMNLEPGILIRMNCPKRYLSLDGQLTGALDT